MLFKDKVVKNQPAMLPHVIRFEDKILRSIRLKRLTKWLVSTSQSFLEFLFLVYGCGNPPLSPILLSYPPLFLLSTLTFPWHHSEGGFAGDGDPVYGEEQVENTQNLPINPSNRRLLIVRVSYS